MCALHHHDTIAAISSVAAPSARIIVRLTGPNAFNIATEISDVAQVSHARAMAATLSFDRLIFPVCIYAFKGPGSYTGEDSIELHLPGSPVLAKMLLGELYRRGARSAEPGEFTARAFFNGKLELTQAEGIAATIAAQSEAQLRAARQLMSGELSRRLLPLTDSLAQTLALIEVGIDFTEEDVTFLANEEIARRIDDADESLADLLDQSQRFEQLNHQPHIIFAGRPNAGKSSLINALTGQARAVVSPIAGTTRDVLSAPLDLPDGQVWLIDAAGLEASVSGDKAVFASARDIDEQMQARADLAIESADHVIGIVDGTDTQEVLKLGRPYDLLVSTKSDLPCPVLGDIRGPTVIRVSSKTGEGLPQLRNSLNQLAFASAGNSAALTLNRRHLQAIEEARQALAGAAARVIENAPELVAMDLRDALDQLGSITGQVTPDDILGRVFSAFCIGK